MVKIQLFLLYAIIVFHLTSGVVVSDLASSGSGSLLLTRSQLDQLAGICTKALNIILDQSSVNQHRTCPCEAANEEIQEVVDARKAKEETQLPVETIILSSKKPIPTNFKKYGSKFYYKENVGRNWFDAVNVCRKMGGQMASINSIQDLNAVNEAVDQGYSYWIDINDLAKNGEYVSLATGNQAPFLPWLSGYPISTTASSCICLDRTKMHNTDCLNIAYFICEAGDDN